MSPGPHQQAPAGLVDRFDERAVRHVRRRIGDLGTRIAERAPCIRGGHSGDDRRDDLTGILGLLASPILDVRFSLRWHSLLTALIAAVLLAVALANLEHLLLAEILLIAGFFFANLYQSALGGWLSSIVSAEQRQSLRVWVTIGNISGGGLMAVITREVVQRLSSAAAAISLGSIVLLPMLVFSWTPAPGTRPAPRERELWPFLHRGGAGA